MAVNNQSNVPQATGYRFNGKDFFDRHKDDDFLTVENVTNVLRFGQPINRVLKRSNGGVKFTASRWHVKPDVPLTIYDGSKFEITEDDFTMNRLRGLCAAWAYVHRDEMPNSCCPIADRLNFHWVPGKDRHIAAYLSFTPGAIHFTDILGYWPIAAILHLARCRKIGHGSVKKALAKRGADGELVKNKLDKHEMRVIYKEMSMKYAMQQLIAREF